MATHKIRCSVCVAKEKAGLWEVSLRGSRLLGRKQRWVSAGNAGRVTKKEASDQERLFRSQKREGINDRCLSFASVCPECRDLTLSNKTLIMKMLLRNGLTFC